MKKLLRLIVAVAAIFLIVRYCTNNLGSVITLPGGTGGSDTEDNGGWFSPKKDSGTKDNTEKTVPDDISDLERQLGIGNDDDSPASVNIPSTTATPSTPLTFKGIPIKGSLSAFGNELVKAGFKSAGNGTYTGDFAGYGGCKITPSGNNPVKEVRVDFPVISDWDTLEKSYDSLQASLTQKYGIEPKTSQGSNLAVYELPNGTISLDADVKNQSSWHVILKYTNSSSTLIAPGNNPIDDL
ncbi:MAG: hypothetical protein IJK05_03635 [Bacteroidales bacterium]|nr:hypothetical protein [Bacteroidales bacterium]